MKKIRNTAYVRILTHKKKIVIQYDHYEIKKELFIEK